MGDIIMQKLLQKIEWPNLLFIVLSPVIAILGTIWTLQTSGSHWGTWVLTVVMLYATGIGITAGYHRLFSHLSYKAHPVVKFFLILLGGAAFQGSVREWCCAHRKHHRFVDSDGDPYNIKRGFWYAHVGWVVLKANQSDESNIKDLLKDRLVMFQDRFYIPLAALVSLLLPGAIATLWGDFWGGFFIAGAARIVVNHHLTFLINSACHFFGSQPYNDLNTARDCWFISLFTYGEGYHNFHHAFETDYRNGLRAYDFDPGKWLVAVLSWLKLATNLKRASEQKILELKLRMQERALQEKVRPHMPSLEECKEFLSRQRQQILEKYARFSELQAEYIRVKKQKIHTRMETVKAEMNRVQEEFKESLNQWQMLMSGKLVPVPLR